MWGKCIFSCLEMQKLFQGINLNDITVSQTINGPAIILLAFYIATGEEQGISPSQLKGTFKMIY